MGARHSQHSMEFLKRPSFWIGALVAFIVLFALEWLPAYHQLSGWREFIIRLVIIFLILRLVEFAYYKIKKK